MGQAYRRGSLSDGFESILDLEEVAIRGENGDSSVVTAHGDALRYVGSIW